MNNAFKTKTIISENDNILVWFCKSWFTVESSWWWRVQIVTTGKSEWALPAFSTHLQMINQSQDCLPGKKIYIEIKISVSYKIIAFQAFNFSFAGKRQFNITDDVKKFTAKHIFTDLDTRMIMSLLWSQTSVGQSISSLQQLWTSTPATLTLRDSK